MGQTGLDLADAVTDAGAVGRIIHGHVDAIMNKQVDGIGWHKWAADMNMVNQAPNRLAVSEIADDDMEGLSPVMIDRGQWGGGD